MNYCEKEVNIYLVSRIGWTDHSWVKQLLVLPV